MHFPDAPATFVRSLQLTTADLEQALQFYCEVVGFRILERDANSAALTADGQSVLLSLVQPAQVLPRQLKTTGLYHFALLLPERSQLALFIRHLARRGVRFGASHHLVSEAIYFYDPEDNGIEVYVDTDPATWNWRESGVSIDTVPLDFDDLLAAAAAVGQGWTGLPPSTIIGHIHLHVSDLRQAEVFYTRGLGFEVVSRYRDSALFLSTGQYHHHIALNTWNGVNAPRPAQNSAGLDYFTLVFPDQHQLDTAVQRLQELSASPQRMGSSLLVEDPAGNAILLTAK